MKYVWIVLFCLATTFAQAQGMGGGGMGSGRGMGGGRMGNNGPPRNAGVEREPMTPQGMAQKETTWMLEKLALTNEQLPKVSAANLKFATEKMKAFQEMRASGNADSDSMRNTMEGITLAQDAELKTIFTDLQWENFQKNKKKMRNR